MYIECVWRGGLNNLNSTIEYFVGSLSLSIVIDCRQRQITLYIYGERESAHATNTNIKWTNNNLLDIAH